MPRTEPDTMEDTSGFEENTEPGSEYTDSESMQSLSDEADALGVEVASEDEVESDEVGAGDDQVDSDGDVIVGRDS